MQDNTQQVQGGLQPQTGNDPFGQNPFSEIINSQQAPVQQPVQPENPEDVPEALQPGKTGDSTKFLIGSIQQLHNFIAQNTEPRTISTVRQIIGLLTKLIDEDQAQAAQVLTSGVPAPQPTSPTVQG